MVRMEKNVNGRYQEKLQNQFLRSTILPILICFAVFAAVLLAYSEGFSRYSLNARAVQARDQADAIYEYYVSYLSDKDAQEDIKKFYGGEISERLMTYAFRMRCEEAPVKADLLLLNNHGEQVYYSGRSDVTALHPEYYRETIFQYRPIDSSVLSRFYYFLGDASWILNAVIFDDSGDSIGQAFILLGEADLELAFHQFSYEIVLADNGGLAAMTTNHDLLDHRHRLLFANRSSYSGDDSSYLVRTVPLTRLDASVSALSERPNWRGYILPYLGALAVILGLIAYQSTRFGRDLALDSARSLEKLHSEMASVQRDPELRISVESDDEFSDIAGGINRMLDHVQELNQKSLALERSRNDLAKAQIKAQFHPHFIYNTLESIRFAILMDDDKRASDMLLALTSLLRYSVEHNDFISLEEDMEHIREYLDIMRFRYGNRFRYQFEIEEDTKSYLIPPLFVQPLLENSLKYGFAGQDTLELSVQTWLDGEELHIRISDNGIGMTEEELTLQRRLLEEGQFAEGHFGIGLVARSLKLQYGEDSTVVLDSEYGKGLTVELTLKKKVDGDGI
ncbi:MAG: histidine kinase [Firmicutes bacterium]|nr:histidine kinase [Bacillota bacterium]